MTRPWAVSWCLAAIAAGAASRKRRNTRSAATIDSFEIPVLPEYRNTPCGDAIPGPESRNAARTPATGNRPCLTVALAAFSLLLQIRPAHAGLDELAGNDAVFRLGTTSASVVERARLTQAGLFGIGLSPTTPLEASGTVSATRFVGNGSGLTGITGGTTTFATSPRSATAASAATSSALVASAVRRLASRTAPPSAIMRWARMCPATTMSPWVGLPSMAT